MTDLAAVVRSARTGAAVFALDERGLLVVRGSDRERFLQGQLTQDVAGLSPDGPRSGAYALALTAQGRIVADAHVLARPDAFWLETHAVFVAPLRARLEKYVIADDVVLEDRSDAVARFGIEGPAAHAALASLAEGEAPALPRDGCAAVRIAGAEVLAAGFGWSGEPAVQLLVPVAARDAVAAALDALVASGAAVRGDAAALEVLRVEAGVPRAGAELAEDVLPAEVGLLERAVSFTKGCYTGQEVVARMHSRGRLGHRLVGLLLEGEPLPGPGARLTRAGRAVGEITSVARSPELGPIALAFVRVGHDEPGTELAADGSAVRVAPLPFATGRGIR